MGGPQDGRADVHLRWLTGVHECSSRDEACVEVRLRPLQRSVVESLRSSESVAGGGKLTSNSPSFQETLRVDSRRHVESLLRSMRRSWDPVRRCLVGAMGDAGELIRSLHPQMSWSTPACPVQAPPSQIRASSDPVSPSHVVVGRVDPTKLSLGSRCELFLYAPEAQNISRKLNLQRKDRVDFGHDVRNDPPPHLSLSLLCTGLRGHIYAEEGLGPVLQ